MKISSLPQLRCIQTHSGSVCHSALELTSAPVTPDFNSSKTELIEGILECRVCNANYPVISGVAIILPRVTSWCRENYLNILNGATHRGSIGSELQQWLQDHQCHLGNRPTDNYYESERWNIIFTATHYDAVASGKQDASPFGRSIESQPQVFEVVDQMIARQLSKPVSRALDIGTNVGGMALRLAKHAHNVIGIDTSFNSVLTARKIQCGTPELQTSYHRYVDGHHYEEYTITHQVSNSEFLVASLYHLPYNDQFDLISALNVIDVVEDPREFLSILAAQVRVGGLLLLTSPYSWGSDDVPIDNWLGASAEHSSADATREAIEQLGFTIVDEQDDVPWVLREHQRWYRVFLNHCILARKLERA